MEDDGPGNEGPRKVDQGRPDWTRVDQGRMDKLPMGTETETEERETSGCDIPSQSR